MTLPASHPRKVAKREEKQKKRAEKAAEKERKAKERAENKKAARKKEIGAMIKRIGAKQAKEQQEFLETVGTGGIKARDARSAGLSNQEIRLLKRISTIASGGASDKAVARLTRQLEKSGPVGKAFLKTFGSEKGFKVSRILIDKVAGKMGIKNFSDKYPTESRQILAKAARETAARYLQERITNRTASGINQYGKRTIMTLTENIVRASMSPERRRKVSAEKRERAQLRKEQRIEMQKARERAGF